MTAELVSKENTQVTFTLTFTGEEFDAETDKVYKEQRAKIAIDGFRKGKAPRSIIEKRYGTEVFFSDAVDNLINAAYVDALKDLDIAPVGYPDVKFGEEKLEKGKGFTATVVVPVEPVVEPKNYKGVKAERKVKAITDADVEKELEVEQKKNSRLEVSSDAAKMGDTVILDYKGFTGEEQFEGGTAEGQTLVLGSNQFIPGFEDQLVGTKAGEDKDVFVTFPEEYHAENLAGKEAVFHCHIQEVKAEILPEINDEFAQDVSEFDTLDEYKESIRKNLQEAAKGAAEYDGKNAVIEKILEENSFDVPAVMVENEADFMMEEMEQNMKQQGFTLEMYCKILNKDKVEMKNEMKDDAKKRVKNRLLMKAIAKLENIEASPEDLEKELAEMAKLYNMEDEKLKEMFKEGSSNLEYLKEDIVNRKTLDFLYENAEFTDVVEEAPVEAETEAIEEAPVEAEAEVVEEAPAEV